VEEASEISRLKKSKDHPNSDQKARFLMLGLEAQEQSWRTNSPSQIATTEPLNMSTLFTQIYLATAPLLQFPTPKVFTKTIAPDPSKMRVILPVLRRFFEAACVVDHSTFSAIDWAHFVLCVVLAMRLSFPLRAVDVGDWDDKAAREELRFGEILQRLTGSSSEGGESTGKGADIGEAGKVILRVVKKKYDDQIDRIVKTEEWRRRVEEQERQQERQRQQQMKPVGCPMIDGSMDEYFSMWDQVEQPLSPEGFLGVIPPHAPPMMPMIPPVPGQYPGPVLGWQHESSWNSSGSGSGSLPEEGQGEGYAGGAGGVLYHDLWATMTMGWASGSDTSGV
jgi:hypothetical protein